MKFFIVLFCVGAVLAADDKAAEKPKTYRRLIPADVLRGKLFLSNFKLFLLKKHKQQTKSN